MESKCSNVQSAKDSYSLKEEAAANTGEASSFSLISISQPVMPPVKIFISGFQIEAKMPLRPKAQHCFQAPQHRFGGFPGYRA